MALHERMPVAAYIKLKIAENIKYGESGSYDWDAESVLSTDNNTKSSNQVAIDFSWRKPGSDGGEQAFNISAFDDTAILLESKIANTSSGATGIHVEYGWCAAGRPVPGRSMTLHGVLKEYSITFQGPSTELNIVARFESLDFMSKSDSRDFPASIYHGNPSEILRAICSEYGWDPSGIEDTENVRDSGSSKNFKTYVQANRSLSEFIKNDLCVDAQTKDGQSSFKFFVDDTYNPPRAFFKSGTSMTPGEVEIEMRDEWGNSGRKTYAGGRNADKRMDSVKTFNYYTGEENNEIISFSPNYTFSAGMGLAENASSINPETGELFTCDIKGSAMSVSEGEDKIVRMEGSRVLGMSGAGFRDLATRSKRLWHTFANIGVTASLEIMGDPIFKFNDHVTINVYTKYGLKHHTSGVYQVTSVTESVSGGIYVTTLELRKFMGQDQNKYYMKERLPEDNPKKEQKPMPSKTESPNTQVDPSNPPLSGRDGFVIH